MRRVTFVVERYWWGALGFSPVTQRTEYYMPWGTVTVDELHRMEFAEFYTVVRVCDEEPPDDYIFGD